MWSLLGMGLHMPRKKITLWSCVITVVAHVCLRYLENENFGYQNFVAVEANSDLLYETQIFLMYFTV